MSATAEPAPVVARVDEIVDRLGGESSSLIQVMLHLQAEERWLPREALQRIHERLKVPLSRVLHIATFYKAFSVVPKGRHQVHVCMGTACHVRGAPRILHTIETVTGVRPGETDAEGKLTVETVNCLGCCALGPVVTVDGRTHGNLSTAKTESVLKGLA